MAVDRQPETMPMLVTRDDQPLVGVVCAHDDALVRYFPDEMAAEGAEPEPIAQAALGAVGSWCDSIGTTWQPPSTAFVTSHLPFP